METDDTYVDRVLAEAQVNSLMTEFKADPDILKEAVDVLFCMDEKLKNIGICSEEENDNIETAIGVIIAHLEKAYPEIKIRAED